ncbi:MAG: transcription termination/antitermination protein NusA [Blastocatellia bacterium]|jgi:N utilization substance protein A|nr:transcription termination/antitermination protein NusA [Blastocatellia bacterium]
MSSSIAQNIETLCQEKGIDREIVIEAMKEAVRAAAKKQFKSGEDIQVDWNAESGIELSATKVVVDEVTNPATELSIVEAKEMAGDDVEIGDALLLPLPMEELGRIAAQTAKQILFQKVRDAERSNIYDQYVDKIGDLVNGYVKRFERGNLIVDLGNLEAILPRSQQSRGEQWAQGERIRVVISNVSKESKGPQVEVSRTSPELLRRLFEMEVPEIYDETVVIKSAVREPGDRAKIAVMSNERDVDPVGACVGMKGSRVQAIIRELRGEKIDIIEWSDEPSVFAANALSPAKVNQVRITDIENRQMEVIVNEDQLSLAIGKRGQNVRLATKLVGWNIDIRSEEELKKEVAQQMGALIASGGAVPLSAIQGVTAQQADALASHDINDIDALASTSVDDLVEYLDLSLDEAEVILSAAQQVIAARDRSKQGDEGEGETDAAAAADVDEEHAIGETAGTEDESGAISESAAGDETEMNTGDEERAAVVEETSGPIEQHAFSAEADPNVEAGDVEPSNEMTNAGYDEAVEGGTSFQAEADIMAEDSADPVALTEADPMSQDELLLQDAGRDLRPDTVTPAPDITSTGAAEIEAAGRIGEGAPPVEEDEPFSPVADLGGEASAPEIQVTSAPEPQYREEAARSGNAPADEKQTDASEDNAAQ